MPVRCCLRFVGSNPAQCAAAREHPQQHAAQPGETGRPSAFASFFGAIAQCWMCGAVATIAASPLRSRCRPVRGAASNATSTAMSPNTPHDANAASVVSNWTGNTVRGVMAARSGRNHRGHTPINGMSRGARMLRVSDVRSCRSCGIVHGAELRSDGSGRFQNRPGTMNMKPSVAAVAATVC